MHGNHIKHMILGGAAILAVLVLSGVSLSTAATFALALACPLSMIFMMRGMNHDGSPQASGGAHGQGHHHETTPETGPARGYESEPRT